MVKHKAALKHKVKTLKGFSEEKYCVFIVGMVAFIGIICMIMTSINNNANKENSIGYTIGSITSTLRGDKSEVPIGETASFELLLIPDDYAVAAALSCGDGTYSAMKGVPPTVSGLYTKFEGGCVYDETGTYEVKAKVLISQGNIAASDASSYPVSYYSDVAVANQKIAGLSTDAEIKKTGTRTNYYDGTKGTSDTSGDSSASSSGGTTANKAAGTQVVGSGSQTAQQMAGQTGNQQASASSEQNEANKNLAESISGALGINRAVLTTIMAVVIIGVVVGAYFGLIKPNQIQTPSSDTEKKLEQWIESEEIKGYQPAQLKEFLLTKGYDEKEVNKAVKHASKKKPK